MCNCETDVCCDTCCGGECGSRIPSDTTSEAYFQAQLFVEYLRQLAMLRSEMGLDQHRYVKMVDHQTQIVE